MGMFKFPHIEEPTLRVKAMRYFMTIFCFFFAVFGLSVITCAALVASQQVDECQFMGHFYTGVYLLLAAGCATAFFSFLACLHTRRSTSPQDFVSLCVVVMVVLVLQVLAAIASHIFYYMASGGELALEMVATLEKYYLEDRSCMDTLQVKFQCCGVRNYTEWLPYSQNAGSVHPYPSSCQCTAGAELCIADSSLFSNATVTTFVHSTPCHDIVLDDLFESLLIPRIVGPVVSVVELLFFLLVIYFLYHVDNRSLVGAYIVKPSKEDTPSERETSCSQWAELQLTRPPTCTLISQQRSLSLSQNETIMHL